MKPKEFTDRLDDARVEAAIEEAERGTSGEICVFVSSRQLGGDDIADRAARRFRNLGLEATRDRNGILIYFVPRDRKFAVIGDRGIHEKCGAALWKEIVDGISSSLARDEFTAAVVDAVDRAGQALATHFPRQDDDRNELPNRVGRD